MVKTSIILDGTQLDVEGDIPVNINLSIADVRKPDERQQSFTKTITIPRSKTNDTVLGHAFEINIDGSYNPKVRKPCKILANDIIQFDGFAQLKNVKQTHEGNWANYEIVVFGKLINMFTAIGKAELTDLDLSEYNHPYNKETQELSWDTSIWKNGASGYVNYSSGVPTGEGYVYPLIDYGYSTNQIDYDVTQLYPAIYLKTYVDEIFTQSGYSYESDFFNSDYFKKLIIPFNRQRLELSSGQVAERQFLARTTAAVSGSVGGGSQFRVMQFPSEDYDTGNLHDPNATVATQTASQMTVAESGRYNIFSNIFVNGEFTPSVSGTVDSNSYIKVTAFIYKNGNALGGSPQRLYIVPPTSFSGTHTTATSPTVSNNTEYYKYYFGTGLGANQLATLNPPNMLSLVENNLQLNAGDTVDIRLFYEYDLEDASNSSPFEQGGSPVSGDLTINTLTNSFFQAQVNNVQIQGGNTVNLNQAIPENIKQKDFLMSVVKMFNLYVDVKSLDDPSTYVIEPREDFYSTGNEDWSDKLDRLNDLEIIPMGLLDAGEYFYSYTQDKDYFNQRYEENWAEIYGQAEIDIDNDFIKERKETKIIFSPTPLADDGFSDIIIPRIINEDNTGSIVPYQGNIRILFYGGLRNANSAWNHIDSSGSTPNGSYPYSGHLDDPVNPTEDLNFDLPREVYYNPPAGSNITWTDSNLYNKYHKKQIDEITNQNSRLVKGMFKLSPMDIYGLSFRKLYWFNNAYHRLHKLIDYNPSDYLLTKCEFLKITGGVAFSAGSYEAGNAYDGHTEIREPRQNGSRPLPDGNVYNPRNKSITVTGEDNVVNPRANDITINGDGNQVGADAERITITGSNNVIEPGVTDVVLVNTDGVTVTESGTWVDGKQDGRTETVSSNTVPDAEVRFYFADTSGGNVTFIPPATGTEGVVWTFKKMDAASNMRVSPSGGTMVDGEPTRTYTSQYDTVTITWNETEGEYSIV